MIAFIETYCVAPDGNLLGKPIKLLPFQKRFIKEVYDNKAGTSRAYLSMARKNGKTALIACLLLAHVAGPEAVLNTQIISGARSREQAGQVFRYASKMVMLSPELSSRIKIVESQKRLVGISKNVEYVAISAEAKTAHGLSPILAILDEVGQVVGPYDAFVEAIETSQGAHDRPLLVAISTQAATDNDLFSRWLDDAESSGDKRIVSHVYTAPEDCKLTDKRAWKAANPALGVFRSRQDMQDGCDRAVRMPTQENSFRWLFLNQRVEASSPFISKGVWQQTSGEPHPLTGMAVFGGFDLSEVADLTSLVLVGVDADGVWHVHPYFWLPGDGLFQKAKADRQPYDVWERQGYLEATPGKTVSYAHVAKHVAELFEILDIRTMAFDRWHFEQFKPHLEAEDLGEAQLAQFEPFGQGFASMSPALRVLEEKLLQGKVRHGGHPVLSMCRANAVVTRYPAGNRKLDKAKSLGRIDGMVALAMAAGVMPKKPEKKPVSGLSRTFYGGSGFDKLSLDRGQDATNYTITSLEVLDITAQNADALGIIDTINFAFLAAQANFQAISALTDRSAPINADITLEGATTVDLSQDAVTLTGFQDAGTFTFTFTGDDDAESIFTADFLDIIDGGRGADLI